MGYGLFPNCAHKEHILAAFAAGKHVFAEKPLATAMEECRTIHAAHQQSGRLFATGFVLRYAPLYLKVGKRRTDRVGSSGSIS